MTLHNRRPPTTATNQHRWFLSTKESNQGWTQAQPQRSKRAGSSTVLHANKAIVIVISVISILLSRSVLSSIIDYY
ncbi:hypothetical protein BO71DRAFT_213193 [Aspergillus ellipticus CBS 707.79]|uniref:Transmembrane protein n=1 Tax=Aspergillus ellipticus CBS 707.79 TaxID=1448320 RepID=A0A319DCH1_9EURO|nr:hypothetical protein BO71DRAFT_213193 [Aspergillus ellipticus CBS 707.79]